MKILLLADKEDPFLWDYYRPGNLDGIDLILSCGDLKANYLSFLVTMGRAPVLYVHGHVHMNYSYGAPRTMQHGDTTVINAWGKYLLEI